MNIWDSIFSDACSKSAIKKKTLFMTNMKKFSLFFGETILKLMSNRLYKKIIFLTFQLQDYFY